MAPWVHKCCWSNVYDSVNESWAGGRGVRCQGRPVGFLVELVSHLEPGEPGDAVLAGVSLAAFTARLPVGTCKALGSWQPWRTPDELICTFTVAGVTCNVGETGCRAVYPRHAVQPSCGSAGGRRARQAGAGLGGPHWEDVPTLVLSPLGWGSYCHLRTSGGWAVAGGPSGALPLTPSQPHLSILSVHEPLGTRRSQGSPHFLFLLSGRTENLREDPQKRYVSSARGPPSASCEGRFTAVSPNRHRTPAPAQLQPKRSQKDTETSFLWPLLPGLERHANTCDFSFPIKVLE